MIWLSLALAVDAELEAGVRSDHVISESWGAGWVSWTGPVELQAYGSMYPGSPNLYLLSAAIGDNQRSAVLGRHRVSLPTAPRMVDGATGTWRFERADLSATAGWSPTADGFVPMGRAELGWSPTGADLRAGLWAEPEALHGDLRAVWPGPAASLHGLLAVGMTPTERGAERARLEVRARPVSGVDVGLHVEHREALGEPVWTPDVLEVFAPEGRQEVGALVGVSGRGTGRLLATAALRHWPEERGSAYGGAASVTLRPPKGCSPSYRMASGPMGVVHSAQALCPVPVPEPGFADLDLNVLGGVAPFRKGTGPWQTAAWLGGTVGISRERLSLNAGAELGTTPMEPMDPRGWMVARWTF